MVMVMVMVVTVIRIEIHSPPPAQRWWSCSEVLPCRLIMELCWITTGDRDWYHRYDEGPGPGGGIFYCTKFGILPKYFYTDEVDKGQPRNKDSSHLPFYTLWRKPTVFHTTLLLHLTNIWLHVFILCQWGPLTFQGDSLLVYIQTILQESSSKGPNVNYGSWLMMKVMTWYCRWHV